jgi:hypothetical protein
MKRFLSMLTLLLAPILASAQTITMPPSATANVGERLTLTVKFADCESLEYSVLPEDGIKKRLVYSDDKSTVILDITPTVPGRFFLTAHGVKGGKLVSARTDITVGGVECCKPKEDGYKYHRGRIAPTPEVSRVRHAESDRMHGKKLAALPVASQPNYDCRVADPAGLIGPKVINVGPVLNQGPCGDCYGVSMTGVGSSAFYTAGVAAYNSGWALSTQWPLDCHPELGGCGGGDEWQVAQLFMATGCPTIADYPGLGQNPARCADTSKMTFYKLTAMGYCTVSAGANSVANTQDIKNCVWSFGPVSVAVAANSDWDAYTSGVLSGAANIGGINHAVSIVGWIDNASSSKFNLPQSSTGGYWIVKNQWDTTWGMNGYAYVPYGNFSIGVEAFWVQAAPVNPPPPNPPGGAPTITSATTATATINTAFSYQIVASNNPTAYAAFGLPAGLTCDPVAGTISGTPTNAGVSTVRLVADNASGDGLATLTLTVTASPPANLLGQGTLTGGQAFEMVPTGSALRSFPARTPQALIDFIMKEYGDVKTAKPTPEVEPKKIVIINAQPTKPILDAFQSSVFESWTMDGKPKLDEPCALVAEIAKAIADPSQVKTDEQLLALQAAAKASMLSAPKLWALIEGDWNTVRQGPSLGDAQRSAYVAAYKKYAAALLVCK